MSETKQPVEFTQAEMIPIADLKPHPRNYRTHPEDQLAHIVRSIEENGFYRNVVAAKDWTILAGHGVVEAAQKMGRTHVPVIRLDLEPDDPRALKVLTGDNQIGQLGLVDDRALTEILKEIKDWGDGTADSLLGTGFDGMMLANLVMVTRPADEIADFDAAAEWLGMPDHSPGQTACGLVIKFEGGEEAREEFLRKLGVAEDEVRRYVAKATTCGMVTMWWPPHKKKDQDDLISVQFVGEGEGDAEQQPEA